MKRLVSFAILLTSILFSPCIIAQTSSAPSAIQPKATPPTIKFDVVDFKRCQAIDIPNKNTIMTGDSIGKRCQTVKTLLDVAFAGGSTYLLKGEPAWSIPTLTIFWPRSRLRTSPHGRRWTSPPRG